MRDRLFDLSGKVALITGGGSGLGLEMARAMAAFGAHVCINGRRREVLETAVKQIAAAGGSASLACFDATDTAATSGAVADTVAEYGSIDILVNNVGLRQRSGVWEISLDQFSRLIESNLTAAFHLAREAARAMIQRGQGGTIINVGTAATKFGQRSDPAYNASKAGLAAITRCLAAELGPHRITVNTILPGAFATEINVPDGQLPQNRGTAILGRLARPDEIGGAAVFLASSAGSFVTGSELSIDGGFGIAM